MPCHLSSGTSNCIYFCWSTDHAGRCLLSWISPALTPDWWRIFISVLLLASFLSACECLQHLVLYKYVDMMLIHCTCICILQTVACYGVLLLTYIFVVMSGSINCCLLLLRMWIENETHWIITRSDIRQSKAHDSSYHVKFISVSFIPLTSSDHWCWSGIREYQQNCCCYSTVCSIL